MPEVQGPWKPEANILLNFRQINQSSLNLDRLCVCKQMKRLITRKVCFEQLTEFQVKKTSDRPSNLHLDANDFATRLLTGSVGSF